MVKETVKTSFAVLIGLAAFGTLNYLILGAPHLCIFRALCGLPCPGCGLTHAGVAMLMLDWRTSLRYHALFLPTALTLFCGCFPSGANRFTDAVNRRHWWHFTLLAFSLGYFVFRLLRFDWDGEWPMCYEPNNYLQLAVDLFRRIFG